MCEFALSTNMMHSYFLDPPHLHGLWASRKGFRLGWWGVRGTGMGGRWPVGRGGGTTQGLGGEVSGSSKY